MAESRYEFVGHEDGLARYERRPVEPEVMYDIPADLLREVAAECEAEEG